ncbi:glycoside hydrolase family 130 protein [Spirosoma arcticum]
MRLPIERSPKVAYPDIKRVINRFFFNGDERATDVIKRVMDLSDEAVARTISPLLQEYSKRHRNISRELGQNFDRLPPLFEGLGIDRDGIDPNRKLLIGAFFTNEYAIESVAFSNPSMIEDPDQTELEAGERRVIVSLRATGEGHISSIVFRRALLDGEANIRLLPTGIYVDEAQIIRNAVFTKQEFFDRACSCQLNEAVLRIVKERLGDEFDYPTLRNVVTDAQDALPDETLKSDYEKVLWLADSTYDLIFSLDTDLSDRVIFPVGEFERNGIEDARFVRFTEDDGRIVYYATYTAYDGATIMPKLLRTDDFLRFTVIPLYGDGARNKNLALFPRKINGQFAMIGRVDGWHNYIMYAHDLNVWQNPILIPQSVNIWQFTQVGNCGSPIETEHGWLVVTHGVGPMRRYCLGASLLRLDDPSVEIGHLAEPLLIPDKEDREGHVPNVVYSCGSIVHNGKLVIPYGLSDYSSSFVRVDLASLLDKLLA